MSKEELPKLTKITPKTRPGLYVAGKDITSYKEVSDCIITLVIPKGTELVIPNGYETSVFRDNYNNKFRVAKVITKRIDKVVNGKVVNAGTKKCLQPQF